ncbi:hypothetical protein SEA_TYPHA_94 [Mycobacterium phage Typha]|uniref:Uncharacterized protein n=1 Tax=Mycobacterium phage Typha TaxID=2517971 RepID=A0A482JC06_9CAUD|nr:hypothetical protein KCH40_gp075 [Mycobacterium phage Typha]QBP29749.1 hypothetical protein SEA_TYPHA_94 [Mycobacterium phage Typha]
MMPVIPPLCLPRPTKRPRDDGAWRIGEPWDPFAWVPDNFRWWRKHLADSDRVVYQLTDDNQAVHLWVELGDGRRVPIPSTLHARARVITTHLTPTWEYADRMIGSARLAVDLLTNYPPHQLIPWRPLTDPGDHNPPPDEREQSHRYGPTFNRHQESTWLPPNRQDLDRIRFGR